MFSFNDTFNTFYLLKDHSDSESGHPQPLLHGLLFSDWQQSHRRDSTYHGICYISCIALAGLMRIDLTTHHTMSVSGAN